MMERIPPPGTFPEGEDRNPEEVGEADPKEDEMTEVHEIYHCEVCGNIVEVINRGDGVLVCCGRPMTLLSSNTTDAAVEKHVPVVEKVDGGFKVSVGSTIHPMEENHFIVWIELDDGDKVCRKHLEPGGEPVVFFQTAAEKATARAYCNLHGLWKG